MLGGLAFDYYSQQILKQGLVEEYGLRAFVCMFSKRFKTRTRRVLMSTEFQSLTLRQIVTTHSAKSLLECTELFVSRMEQLRTCLPDYFALHDEVYITHLLSAVVGFPEFDHIRQDPPEETAAVIEKLFWAASQSTTKPTNVGSTHTAQISLISPANHDGTTSANFVSRTYCGRSRSPNPPRHYNNYRPRSRSSSSFNDRPYRPHRRENYDRSRSPVPRRSIYRDRNGAGDTNKPCPICEEPGCCADNHTAAEHVAAARRDFKVRRFLDRLDGASSHYGDQ